MDWDLVPATPGPQQHQHQHSSLSSSSSSPHHSVANNNNDRASPPSAIPPPSPSPAAHSSSSFPPPASPSSAPSSAFSSQRPSSPPPPPLPHSQFSASSSSSRAGYGSSSGPSHSSVHSSSSSTNSSSSHPASPHSASHSASASHSPHWAAASKAAWRDAGPGLRLSDHVILAGDQEGFLEFARVLHSCSGLVDPESGVSRLQLLVIHPDLHEATLLALGALGPVQVVRGSVADPGSLLAACASRARCLVHLGSTDRPVAASHGAHASLAAAGGPPIIDEHGQDYGATSRAAVLADAQALLACYGVGEDVHRPASEPSLAHSVVELSYTSSVRYLQPGLLLQGTSVWDSASCSVLGPRRSWLQRQEAEDAAGDAGLVEWQANIYYCAGRVVVPALLDTFICQAIHKKSLLCDFMDELCGDDGRPGGALLRQLPVPPGFAGRTYRELFRHVLSTHGAVPLGLYRSKPENPTWRLHYVSLNPAWSDVVGEQDRVFILRNSQPHDAAHQQPHQPHASAV